MECEDQNKQIKAVYLLKFENDIPSHIEISLGYMGAKKTLRGVNRCFYKIMESLIFVPPEDEMVYLSDDAYLEHAGDKVLQTCFTYDSLKDIGFKGRRISAIDGEIEIEEINSLEVLAGDSGSVKVPYTVYTKNIFSGIGIAAYDNIYKSGTLYHITSDQNISKTCIDALENIIENSSKDLSVFLISGIKSGLAKSDYDKIHSAKKKSSNFLFKNKSSIRDLQMNIDDSVSKVNYLSVDTWKISFNIF